MTLFLLLAFLTGGFACLGAAVHFHRSPLVARLSRLGFGEAEPAEPSPSLAARLERLLAPLARIGGGDSEEVRKRLVQAGFRDERSLVLFLGGRIALPAAGLFFFLGLGPLIGIPASQRLVAGLLSGAGGYILPGLVLDRIRTGRQATIRKALPDALDLLLICLEAGLALGGALGRVARELMRTSPPLCEELRLVTREMQAGKSTAEALEGLAERVGIEDVNALVAMLVQSERFGTGIADALRVHTQGLRRDRMQRAEEQAQKAAVKMVLPAGLFIFPSILVVAVGPAALRFADMFGR